jgi:hypothetical protein
MGKRSRKRRLSEGGSGPTERGAGRPERPDGSSAGADSSGAEAAPSSRAERDAERRRRRAEAAAAGSEPPRGGRRRGTRERPRPPWGSFPLTELVVLLALILGVAGLIVWREQGQVMLLAGFALGSLAGLELATREHFAGYRSHSTLLAACAGVAAGALVVVAVPGAGPRLPTLAVGLVIFAVGFWLFREAFKRRSGGLGFR